MRLDGRIQVFICICGTRERGQTIIPLYFFERGPHLPFLFLSLQCGQSLLLFPLQLQQGLAPLLQLQVSTLKVLPLLVLKGY